MAADRIIRYIRPGFRLANVSFNFILPRCNEDRQNFRLRYSYHRATYAPGLPRGWLAQSRYGIIERCEIIERNSSMQYSDMRILESNALIFL